MKKKICVFVLFLAGCLIAEPVIDMTFEIDKNDNVKLTYLTVEEGTRQRFFTEEKGPYEVLILDQNNNTIDSHQFNAEFWLQSDPPKPLGASIHDYKLGYSDAANVLLIKHGDKEIFRKFLKPPGKCNKNGICEGDEDALSCFRDCNSSSRDHYCSGLSDGVCDPDCIYKSKDPDCLASFFPQSECFPSFGLILLVAFVTIRSTQPKNYTKPTNSG